MVIVFLFLLNVGVTPCFHCTVLIIVYKVYTCYFHNTVVSSCYRLQVSYFCLHVAGVTSEQVVLIYSWNVSLAWSWWESAHIQFNLWAVYYDMFLRDETWCQLHHEGSCIKCQQLCSLPTWYPSGHIHYLRHTLRFPVRSSWICCIIIESGIFLW